MALAGMSKCHFGIYICRQFGHNVSRAGRRSLGRSLSGSSVSESKKMPKVKPPGKFKVLVEKKYLGFTDIWGRRLEVNFPKTHKLYVLVKTGMKTFFADAKTLYRVSAGMLGGAKHSDYNYQELVVFRQMPSDMIKMLPVLTIAALPFAPYFIFPLAYLFPRQLLCRHFWTPEQRCRFGECDLSSREQHFHRVLAYMAKHSRDVRDPRIP